MRLANGFIFFCVLSVISSNILINKRKNTNLNNRPINQISSLATPFPGQHYYGNINGLPQVKNNRSSLREINNYTEK